MSPSQLTRPPLLLHTIAGRQRAERRDREDRFRQTRRPIAHTLARTDAPWHRLDVRHWDALAHTSVSVLGILDTQAVEAIDDAVRTADLRRHTLSVELREISSVTPDALAALLAPHSGRRTTADRFCGMQARLACAEQLRHALDDDRFVLCWQPIIDLATDTATHYEVLVRMIGVGGEVIAPVEFIETAEQFGLIGELDRWVVRAAIQQLAADKDGGYRLELNLSGCSVGDPELPEWIERELATAGVDPGRLVFEITETAAIASMAHARVFAQRVRRLGCRLALDDFGAGFSSLSYLKHLPVDYVKIDGDFIRNLAGSVTDQLVVKAIVDIARAMGVKTVAEFVENAETVAMLREKGIDYSQGYYHGRPRPMPRRRLPSESGTLGSQASANVQL